MDTFSQNFDVILQHRILKCRPCGYAIAPPAVHTHLHDQHRHVSRQQRLLFAEHVHSLTELAQTPTLVIYPRPSDPLVDGFPYHRDGFRCNAVQADGLLCGHIVRTRRARLGQQQKRGGHATLKQVDSPNRIWATNVSCQTFFQHPKWLRYFEVTLADNSQETEHTEDGGDQRNEFFATQRADIVLGREDALEAANYVEGFDQHHSTVVPWLQTMGIADHVCGLRKDQIQSAVALPDENEEPTLYTITMAMQDVLETAHSWCSDGPN
ncbi:hypothetical protein LTR49_028008, partial [Elasticomyces elasticus]